MKRNKLLLRTLFLRPEIRLCHGFEKQNPFLRGCLCFHFCLLLVLFCFWQWWKGKGSFRSLACPSDKTVAAIFVSLVFFTVDIVFCRRACCFWSCGLVGPESTVVWFDTNKQQKESCSLNSGLGWGRDDRIETAWPFKLIFWHRKATRLCLRKRKK